LSDDKGMTIETTSEERTLSPLEQFVRAYLEATGGVWEEIEPQVYDVLLPPSVDGAAPAAGGGMLRISFDPEALPDHPGAQLASFGTPFIDRLLGEALQRGRSARFWVIGLNLMPHDLTTRLRRALTVAAPGELRIERVRALEFPQAVFWFRVEFVSDQKEQVVVPAAIDLHYGREVRHLEPLLSPTHLAEQPAQPLPEVRHASVAAAYATTWAEAQRTITALANIRGRELEERSQQQLARLHQYYADLRSELEDQSRRGRPADDAEERLKQRRAALDREEQQRVAELRQKSTLQVSVSLLQLLQVQQPKLLVQATLTVPKRPPGQLEVVWDPLSETVEAPPCPSCGRPGYAFDIDRLGHVVCPSCAGGDAAARKQR
jgi:hypothetical protein